MKTIKTICAFFKNHRFQLALAVFEYFLTAVNPLPAQQISTGSFENQSVYWSAKAGSTLDEARFDFSNTSGLKETHSGAATKVSGLNCSEITESTKGASTGILNTEKPQQLPGFYKLKDCKEDISSLQSAVRSPHPVVLSRIAR